MRVRISCLGDWQKVIKNDEKDRREREREGGMILRGKNKHGGNVGVNWKRS